MNAIFIHDLRVTTRIGVYEWERQLPQTIRIDLDIELPSARPFQSGELADAVDYAAVVARVKAFAAQNPHPLMERFTEALAALVLDEFGAPGVRVRVAKLGALPGVREIGVTIERRRGNLSTTLSS
jgi:dihydroneopterin aldolase